MANQAAASGRFEQSFMFHMIRDFFLPYIALRNEGEGYAVSIVKAGATIVGHSAGPVRPPLSELLPAEVEELRALIAKLGPQ